MGATASTGCARLDCASAVEECTAGALTKRQQAVLFDCAGEQPPSRSGRQQQGGSAASSTGPGPAAQSAADGAPKVRVVSGRFSIRRLRGDVEWRKRYTLGRELGAGQTATVVEAFCTLPGAEDIEWAGPSAGVCGSSCSAALGAASGEARGRRSEGARRGRRVALKRFHEVGSIMFHQELQALGAVGVHPNVLRLLEVFGCGRGEEDVLVLEYCDGGDLYDLYARNNGCCIVETFVVHLLRQLLLALRHLACCGVEHRDVKPENLLVYGASAEHVELPLLKLADFGWATVLRPGAVRPPVAPEGVGSLWYAPPELNPPPAAEAEALPGGAAAKAEEAEAPLGSCDLWSVGVIAYLLLVGHSPFNQALCLREPAAREAEVMRLAALGQVNTAVRPWPMLSREARGFISALIQPCADKRMSAAEAWEHPFISQRDGAAVADLGAQQLPGGRSDVERGRRWRSLDGLQQLGWLAFARAAAEAELVEDPKLLELIELRPGSTAAIYFEQLAKELAHMVTPAWFAPESAWADVLRLAFLYLDVDANGLLSAADLVHHFDGEEAKALVDSWVLKWRRPAAGLLAFGGHGLTFADFCGALHASERAGAPVAAADVLGHVPAEQPTEVASKSPLLADAVLQTRLQGLDDVCQHFLDEEFDRHGFGL